MFSKFSVNIRWYSDDLGEEKTVFVLLKLWRSAKFYCKDEQLLQMLPNGAANMWAGHSSQKWLKRNKEGKGRTAATEDFKSS